MFILRSGSDTELICWPAWAPPSLAVSVIGIGKNCVNTILGLTQSGMIRLAQPPSMVLPSRLDLGSMTFVIINSRLGKSEKQWFRAVRIIVIDLEAGRQYRKVSFLATSDNCSNETRYSNQRSLRHGYDRDSF